MVDRAVRQLLCGVGILLVAACVGRLGLGKSFAAKVWEDACQAGALVFVLKFGESQRTATSSTEAVLSTALGASIGALSALMRACNATLLVVAVAMLLIHHPCPSKALAATKNPALLGSPSAVQYLPSVGFWQLLLSAFWFVSRTAAGSGLFGSLAAALCHTALLVAAVELGAVLAGPQEPGPQRHGEDSAGGSSGACAEGVAGHAGVVQQPSLPPYKAAGFVRCSSTSAALGQALAAPGSSSVTAGGALRYLSSPTPRLLRRSSSAAAASAAAATAAAGVGCFPSASVPTERIADAAEGSSPSAYGERWSLDRSYHHQQQRQQQVQPLRSPGVRRSTAVSPGGGVAVIAETVAEAAEGAELLSPLAALDGSLRISGVTPCLGADAEAGVAGTGPHGQSHLIADGEVPRPAPPTALDSADEQDGIPWQQPQPGAPASQQQQQHRYHSYPHPHRDGPCQRRVTGSTHDYIMLASTLPGGAGCGSGCTEEDEGDEYDEDDSDEYSEEEEDGYDSDGCFSLTLEANGGANGTGFPGGLVQGPGMVAATCVGGQDGGAVGVSSEAGGAVEAGVVIAAPAEGVAAAATTAASSSATPAATHCMECVDAAAVGCPGLDVSATAIVRQMPYDSICTSVPLYGCNEAGGEDAEEDLMSLGEVEAAAAAAAVAEPGDAYPADAVPAAASVCNPDMATIAAAAAAAAAVGALDKMASSRAVCCLFGRGLDGSIGPEDSYLAWPSPATGITRDPSQQLPPPLLPPPLHHHHHLHHSLQLQQDQQLLRLPAGVVLGAPLAGAAACADTVGLAAAAGGCSAAAAGPERLVQWGSCGAEGAGVPLQEATLARHTAASYLLQQQQQLLAVLHGADGPGAGPGAPAVGGVHLAEAAAPCFAYQGPPSPSYDLLDSFLRDSVMVASGGYGQVLDPYDDAAAAAADDGMEGGAAECAQRAAADSADAAAEAWRQHRRMQQQQLRQRTRAQPARRLSAGQLYARAVYGGVVQPYAAAALPDPILTYPNQHTELPQQQPLQQAEHQQHYGHHRAEQQEKGGVVQGGRSEAHAHGGQEPLYGGAMCPGQGEAVPGPFSLPSMATGASSTAAAAAYVNDGGLVWQPSAHGAADPWVGTSSPFRHLRDDRVQPQSHLQSLHRREFLSLDEGRRQQRAAVVEGGATEEVESDVRWRKPGHLQAVPGPAAAVAGPCMSAAQEPEDEETFGLEDDFTCGGPGASGSPQPGRSDSPGRPEWQQRRERYEQQHWQPHLTHASAVRRATDGGGSPVRGCPPDVPLPGMGGSGGASHGGPHGQHSVTERRANASGGGGSLDVAGAALRSGPAAAAGAAMSPPAPGAAAPTLVQPFTAVGSLYRSLSLQHRPSYGSQRRSVDVSRIGRMGSVVRGPLPQQQSQAAGAGSGGGGGEGAAGAAPLTPRRQTLPSAACEAASPAAATATSGTPSTSPRGLTEPRSQAPPFVQPVSPFACHATAAAAAAEGVPPLPVPVPVPVPRAAAGSKGGPSGAAAVPGASGAVPAAPAAAAGHSHSELQVDLGPAASASTSMATRLTLPSDGCGARYCSGGGLMSPPTHGSWGRASYSNGVGEEEEGELLAAAAAAADVRAQRHA